MHGCSRASSTALRDPRCLRSPRPLQDLEEAAVSADIGDLEALWKKRASIRAFKPEPIDRDTLVRMFAAAQHTPSWCNVQPWHVVITEPPKTAALADVMVAAAKSGLAQAGVRVPLQYPP